MEKKSGKKDRHQTNFNNPSHTRRCKIEKPTNNTTIHKLLKSV